jgi:hypothetical protein
VGGLGHIGSLTLASETMHAGVGPTVANIAIGVLSAVIDNIPLMFAVLTVNPAIDPGQWLLITFTLAVFCDRRLSAPAVLSFRASSVILIEPVERSAGVVKVLDRWLKRLGRIACLVGLHDFRVVEVTFGFGGADAIEKLECRRCGRTAARRA